MKTIIARWESRSGKHWVELNVIGTSYGYTGKDCGGGLAATNEADALVEMQARVDKGYFQPDAAKTAMKRVPVVPNESVSK